MMIYLAVAGAVVAGLIVAAKLGAGAWARDRLAAWVDRQGEAPRSEQQPYPPERDYQGNVDKAVDD